MTSLIPAKVIGKIVLCYCDTNARYASATGMVLVNIVANGEELVSDVHILHGVGIA
jgi:hypothetical protein